MAIESRSAALRSDVSSDAFSLAAVDADRTPMPSAGMKAISDITNQAAMLSVEAMRTAPAGLGNIVGGNNAVMPPPAQQISGVNGACLALAGLAVGAAVMDGRSPKKPAAKAAPAAAAVAEASEGKKTIQVTDSTGNTMWQSTEPEAKPAEAVTATAPAEPPAEPTAETKKEPASEDYDLMVVDTNKNGGIDGNDQVVAFSKGSPGDGEITATVRDFVDGKQYGSFGSSEERMAKLESAVLSSA